MFLYLRQLIKTRVFTRTRLLSQFTKRRGFASAPASKFLVQTIEKKNESGMLHMTWNNNSVNRYPFMYLRDNCRCSECFHESSLQRIFDTVGGLDLKIVPEKIEVSHDGEQLVITWSDSHVSAFDSEWLHSRLLKDSEHSGNERSILNREGVEFWNAEKLQDKIPRSDFQELLRDDLALFQWLGVALVTNTPLQVGQVLKLCERVGYSRTTHYG